MNLKQFLDMQRQLQIKMKEVNPTQGGDPYTMTQEQLEWFITWNHSALIVELGEMMGEVSWKPWASGEFCNHPAALHEMVDAWHFFMNILLAIGAMTGWDMGEIVQEFESYYKLKNAKNLQRQVDGYDGVTGKCSTCHRDLQEIPSTQATIIYNDLEYCSGQCAEEAQIQHERSTRTD